MKTNKYFLFVLPAILCLFIAFTISSPEDNEGIDNTPFISGNLYSYSGCLTEPVEGADFYIFNRTTNTMICEGKTDSRGVFICKSFYKDPRLVYLHFTKNGKVGCYLLEQNQGNISGLKICMTNSSSCPNEW